MEIPEEFRDEKTGRFKKGNPGSKITNEEKGVILSFDGIRDQYGHFLPAHQRTSKSAAQRMLLKKIAVQRHCTAKDVTFMMDLLKKLANGAKSEEVQRKAIVDYLSYTIGKPEQTSHITAETHNTTQTMTIDVSKLSMETLKRIEQESSEEEIRITNNQSTTSESGDMQA